LTPARVFWGTRTRLNELFGAAADTIEVTQRAYVWRYKSPRHSLELWRTVYGPLQKAFGTLDESVQEQLAIDLLALIDRFNTATDGTMVAPADYFEVIVTKRAGWILGLVFVALLLFLLSRKWSIENSDTTGLG
jgi:hypothetical protein